MSSIVAYSVGYATFSWAAVAFTAAVVMQQIAAANMRARQAAMQAQADSQADAAKGLQLTTSGNSAQIPVCYGRNLVGGTRVYQYTANTWNSTNENIQAIFASIINTLYLNYPNSKVYFNYSTTYPLPFNIPSSYSKSSGWGNFVAQSVTDVNSIPVGISANDFWIKTNEVVFPFHLYIMGGTGYTNISLFGLGLSGFTSASAHKVNNIFYGGDKNTAELHYGMINGDLWIDTESSATINTYLFNATTTNTLYNAVPAPGQLNMVPGRAYTIVSQGTNTVGKYSSNGAYIPGTTLTDFTLIGAPNNTVGTSFVMTNTNLPTGSGTAHYLSSFSQISGLDIITNSFQLFNNNLNTPGIVATYNPSSTIGRGTIVPAGITYGIKGGTNTGTGNNHEFLLVQQAICFGGIHNICQIDVDNKPYDSSLFRGSGSFGQRLSVNLEGTLANPNTAVNDQSRLNAIFYDVCYASSVHYIDRNNPNGPQFQGIPNLQFYLEGMELQYIVKSVSLALYQWSSTTPTVPNTTFSYNWSGSQTLSIGSWTMTPGNGSSGQSLYSFTQTISTRNDSNIVQNTSPGSIIEGGTALEKSLGLGTWSSTTTASLIGIYNSPAAINAVSNANNLPLFNYALSSDRVYYNNPALVLLDYLLNPLYGRGLSKDSLDYESFYKASLVCNIIVTRNAPSSGKLWKAKVPRVKVDLGFVSILYNTSTHVTTASGNGTAIVIFDTSYTNWNAAQPATTTLQYANGYTNRVNPSITPASNVDPTTGAIIFNGYANGDSITFENAMVGDTNKFTTNMPGALVDASTAYYVVNAVPGSSIFQVSMTLGGTPVNIVSSSKTAQFNTANESFYRDLPLYECNMGIDTSKAIRDNINLIINTMGMAELIWSGGKYKLSLVYPYVYGLNGDQTYLSSTPPTTPIYNMDDVVQYTDSNNNIDFWKCINTNVPAVLGGPSSDPTNWIGSNYALGGVIAAYINDNNILRSTTNSIQWPNAQTRLNYCTVSFLNESQNFAQDTVSWPTKTGTVEGPQVNKGIWYNGGYYHKSDIVYYSPAIDYRYNLGIVSFGTNNSVAPCSATIYATSATTTDYIHVDTNLTVSMQYLGTTQTISQILTSWATNTVLVQFQNPWNTTTYDSLGNPISATGNAISNSAVYQVINWNTYGPNTFQLSQDGINPIPLGINGSVSGVSTVSFGIAIEYQLQNGVISVEGLGSDKGIWNPGNGQYISNYKTQNLPNPIGGPAYIAMQYQSAPIWAEPLNKWGDPTLAYNPGFIYYAGDIVHCTTYNAAISIPQRWNEPYYTSWVAQRNISYNENPNIGSPDRCTDASIWKEDYGSGVIRSVMAPLNDSGWISYKDYQLYLTFKAEDNGCPLESEVFATGVCDFWHAQAITEEKVRASRISNTYELSLTRDLFNLEPGDLVKVNSAVLNIPGEILRIDTVKFGSPGSVDIGCTKFDAINLAWNNTINQVDKQRNLWADTSYYTEPQATNLNYVYSDGYPKNGILSWTPAVNVTNCSYNIKVLQQSLSLSAQVIYNPNTLGDGLTSWKTIGNVIGTSFNIPDTLAAGNYTFTVVSASGAIETDRYLGSGWPMINIAISPYVNVVNSNPIPNTVTNLQIYIASSTTPVISTSSSFVSATNVLSSIPAGWSTTEPISSNPIWTAYCLLVIPQGSLSSAVTVNWGQPQLVSINGNTGSNSNTSSGSTTASDTVSIVLSNPLLTVPQDSYGNNGPYTASNGTCTVMLGSTTVNSACAFSIDTTVNPQVNCTVSIIASGTNAGNYTLSNLVGNTGSFWINIVYAGFSYTVQILIKSAPTGYYLANGSINGSTITGSLFQTSNVASSGIKIDSTSLRTYNSSLTQTSNIAADGSGWFGTMATPVIAWDTLGNISISGFIVTSSTFSSSSGFVGVSTGTNSFWAGGAAGSAPFNVTSAGYLTATSGKVGGWGLNSNSLYSTNARLYSNSTDGYLSLGSSSITSYATATTNNGAFIGSESGVAKLNLTNGTKFIRWDGTSLTWNGGNSSIDSSGNLTALSGVLGGATDGWAIGAGTLSALGIGVIQTSTSALTGIKINSTTGIVGYNGSAVQTIKIGTDGSGWLGINAISWSTTGTVTAGGFTIGATYLTSSNLKASYSDVDPGVYLGTDGIGLGTGQFTVSNAGYLTATSGIIGGNVLGAHSISSSNFVSGLSGYALTDSGYAEFGNVTVRGTLATSVFKYQTISAVGGTVMVSNADVLAVDMTSIQTTIITKGNTTFSVGDILWLKDGFHSEFIKVGTLVSGTFSLNPASPAQLTYNVTRATGGITPTAIGGITAPSGTAYAWPAGTALVSTGNNATAVNATIINSTGISGTSVVATVTFPTQSVLPVAGNSVTITGISPAGYNGTYTILASPAPTATSLSYSNTTTGSQTIAGTVNYGGVSGWVTIDSSSAFSPYIDVYSRSNDTSVSLTSRLGFLGGITDTTVGLSAGTNTWGLYSSNVYLTGTLVANKGYIGGTGGWTIQAGTYPSIYTGTKSTLGSTNSGLYIGTDGISISSSNAFNVTAAGVLTATTGYIGGVSGWTMAAGYLYTTTAGMYVSDYPFYAGSIVGSRATAPFRVDTSGNLTATSATITGVITANTGRIGGASGWVIQNGTYPGIYTSTKSTLASVVSGIYIGSDGISIGNGSTNPFSVTAAGVLVANSGSIGNWNLSTALYSGSKVSYASAASGIYLGTDGISSANGSAVTFSVSSSGVLSATGANISGSITITGSSSGYSNLTDKPTSLSAISSTDGAKLAGIAAGATTNINLVGTANMVLSGNSVYKNGSNGAWTDGVYSNDGYTGGCFASWVVTSTGSYTMMGITTNPSGTVTLNGYNAINAGFYMQSGGVLTGIVAPGSYSIIMGSYTAYTVGDVLSITYDNVYYRYYKNGVLIYGPIAAPSNQTMYLGSSFYTAETSTTGVNNIQFGPLSTIPATLGTVSASGLYLSSTQLGFYNGSAWKTYMDSSGNFYLSGSPGSLSWIASTGTLAITGLITATGGTIGGFNIGTNLTYGLKASYNDANAGVFIGATGIGLGAASTGFYVSSSGALSATGANISGTINSTAGDISTTGYLYAEGTSTYSSSISGWSTVFSSIYGKATGTGGVGVFGSTDNGAGLIGNATGTGCGILAQANGAGNGVLAISSSGSGVSASSATGVGVSGTGITGGSFYSTGSGNGIYVSALTNYFSGIITGAFTTPVGFISGLTMSLYSTTQIQIAKGSAADSTGTTLINLTYTQITSTLSIGAGGLDTGFPAANTWYYFYLIQNSGNPTSVTVLYSLSATIPTIPGGYARFRYIGAAKTNASTQWTPFIQVGREFYWQTPILDVSTAASGTTAVTVTASVPLGRKMKLIGNGISGSINYISDLSTVDMAPSATVAPIASVSTSAARFEVTTNTSGQYRRRSLTSSTCYLTTIGWVDPADS